MGRTKERSRDKLLRFKANELVQKENRKMREIGGKGDFTYWKEKPKLG